nr:hypothetical protein [Tanacetum cinerariifolium]
LEDSKDDGNDEEDQGLKDGDEERLNEEEEADELYQDVDINQGRGLQLSQDIEDSYVTLTLVNPDGQQESSLVSSQFVTSMLKPTSDAGMESIFATASSLVAPLQTSIPIMTPSTIATIITISHAPIPPTTIPSEVLQNLPTFDSVFRFEDSLKSLEANFSEYIQTNPFVEAVSNIPVQIQTDRLHDSYQRENDEFLRTIDENMKRIIKEQALVDAYKADKTILDSYGEKVILKRRRDDDDDQEEGSSAGSDRGSKRRREGKEPESASAPLKTATRSACRSTTGSKSRQVSASQQYPHNLLLPLSLIPNNRGRRVIPFAHFINNDLEYLRGGASSRKYTTSVTKTKVADYENIKWIEDLVTRSMRIIAVMDLKIVEWHSYKHLDWITVRHDDDKLYKFKEGDFKRLRLQDIEDMLLLLIQGKLSNLTVEERFAFNVSLRMFTRSIVIQRRVEDLQLGVESYQKRLNLTKPDTYQSDLNDGTLNDVCNALDDRLKGIRMQYLPQTIWRKGDKDRAAAIIQAIGKMLNTRRIMRSLERLLQPNMGEWQSHIRPTALLLTVLMHDTYRWSEDGNPARANIKQALGSVRRSYALSWKPYQGDSLNLPDHRYKVGVAASF